MNFYNTLLEHYYLIESLETTIKANPHIPENIIRHYHSTALPDNNKQDRLLSHVLKLHSSGAITPNTAHLLKPHLTALSVTNQLAKLKNLNTLNDHINATSEMQTKTVSKKERISKNTPIVFTSKDGNIVVKQHLNQESAIKGASMHPENPMYNKTKSKGKCQWCVSADNDDGVLNFDDYTEHGKYPLYTVHNKLTRRQYAVVPAPIEDGKSSELRDEQNNVVKPYNLLINNPGLEHSPVGDFIKQYHPNAIKTLNVLPHNATPTQIQNAINSGIESLQSAAINHPNVTANNLLSALDSTHRDIHIAVMNHKLVNKDIITKALGKQFRQYVRHQAIQHPLVDESHLTLAMGDHDDLIYGAAVAHPKASYDQVKSGLASTNEYIRERAISNNKATPSQIATALNDKLNLGVRVAAISNANANENHITKALSDTEYEVKLAAIKHKNVTEDNLTLALKDKKHDFIRKYALDSHLITKDHLTQALNDENKYVRAKVLRHHLATIDHLKAGLIDNDPYVRGEAQRIIIKRKMV